MGWRRDTVGSKRQTRGVGWRRGGAKTVYDDDIYLVKIDLIELNPFRCDALVWTDVCT